MSGPYTGQWDRTCSRLRAVAVTSAIERVGRRQWSRFLLAMSAATVVLAAGTFVTFQGQHGWSSNPDVAVLERPEGPLFAFDAAGQSAKYAAATRLSQSGEVAVPEIRAALVAHAHDAETKYWLVIALGNMQASAAAHRLLAGLMADREVDIYAASFLALNGDSRAITLLRTAARDRSDTSRAMEAANLLQP